MSSSILSVSEVDMTRKIIFGAMVAFVIAFVLQNTQLVEVKFLLWKVTMSRALLLLATFLIGVVSTFVLKIPISKKKKPVTPNRRRD